MKIDDKPMIILLVGFIIVMASMLLSGSGIPRILLIVGVLIMNIAFWLIFDNPKVAEKPKKKRKKAKQKD